MKFTIFSFLFLSLFLLFVSCRNYIGSDAVNQRINDLKEKYPVPNLTKSEMYADFDTLVSIMERCNPQYLVRKKVTGYDLVAEIKAQREQIENCENTLDFIRLMKKSLFLALDEHCFIGKHVWFYKNNRYKENIKINKIKNRDFGINFHYIHDVFHIYPPKIDLIYIQGRYFLKNKTTFFYDTDSIVLHTGTEILNFNSQPILFYLDSIKSLGTRWDFNKKIYYNSLLWIENPPNIISFKIEDTIKEYSFTSLSSVEDDEMKRLTETKFQSKWFDKDSVIIINIPQMIYSQSWLEQLKSELMLYKDKPVQSVIIDIRGNPGGSNAAWLSVLDMLLESPLTYTPRLAATTDNDVIKRIRHKLPKEGRKKLNKDKEIIYFDFIDPHNPFCLVETYTQTTKHPDSLNAQNLGYKGTIYLLVDEDIYSSSGAFTALRNSTDIKIKTIGMPTGKLLGSGIEPNVFILPNSRLMFTLQLTLDPVGVSKAEDFYHDHVDFPITPSIDYYKYWYDPDRPYIIDEKSMYEHDEVFIKALEIIKNNQ